VLWEKNEMSQGLVCLASLFPVTAFLIANRKSLEIKDLSPILTYLKSKSNVKPHDSMGNKSRVGKTSAVFHSGWQVKEIKLALPDGHQRPHTSRFLKRAGFNLEGYSDETSNRRPSADLDWLGIKVIRPQDMPLQVANANFDLAITGEDWMREHLYRFPSSPVEELLALSFGTVKIVVAVSQDMPVTDIDELRSLVQSGKLTIPIRVASEYINISDKYLRDNHIDPYKLIPTWGASEAFLPEDADVLIDNTETGKTLQQHNLKIIDVIFQSSACLIGNKDSLAHSDKRKRVEFIVQMLRTGLA